VTRWTTWSRSHAMHARPWPLSVSSRALTVRLRTTTKQTARFATLREEIEGEDRRDHDADDNYDDCDYISDVAH
jgi:hypothetical protein